MTFARAAQRRDWWLKLMQHHPEIQQFGQPHSGSTWGGKTACLHTCVQAVLLGWTGTLYTIDEISEMADYPNPPIMSAARWDLSSDQAVDASIRALSNAGVACEFVQWDWADLEERSRTHGPVIFGCAYDAQPEWRGYVYKDSVSTGNPNGFARPLGRAGKTQLSGFKGGHAELLIGIRDVIGKDGSLKRRDNYVKDPNHGSPARPERPPYDIMTSAQGRYLYESWSTLGDRRRWAVVPLSVHDTFK